MEEVSFMRATSNAEWTTPSGRKRVFMQASPKRRSKEQSESADKLSWISAVGTVEARGKDKRKRLFKNLTFLRQYDRPPAPANLAYK